MGHLSAKAINSLVDNEAMEERIVNGYIQVFGLALLSMRRRGEERRKAESAERTYNDVVEKLVVTYKTYTPGRL
jgi:hypothetical protein